MHNNPRGMQKPVCDYVYNPACAHEACKTLSHLSKPIPPTAVCGAYVPAGLWQGADSAGAGQPATSGKPPFTAAQGRCPQQASIIISTSAPCLTLTERRRAQSPTCPWTERWTWSRMHLCLPGRGTSTRYVHGPPPQSQSRLLSTHQLLPALVCVCACVCV